MSILNEAKLNLKNSLNRLEKAIDVKIKQLAAEREQYIEEREELLRTRDAYTAQLVNDDFARQDGSSVVNQEQLEDLSEQIQKLTAEISDKADEIIYLREQNSEINGKLQTTLEENKNIREMLDETHSKVKIIITEVQQHLANAG